MSEIRWIAEGGLPGYRKGVTRLYQAVHSLTPLLSGFDLADVMFEGDHVTPKNWFIWKELSHVCQEAHRWRTTFHVGSTRAYKTEASNLLLEAMKEWEQKQEITSDVLDIYYAWLYCNRPPLPMSFIEVLDTLIAEKVYEQSQPGNTTAED